MRNPESVEIVKLREMRQAVNDLVENMKRDGWIGDDSEGAAMLDQAFLKLYAEYGQRYQAEQADNERTNLFGKYHEKT